MKLVELFEAVKEKNLTKTQLEDYHASLTSLFAQMHLEMANLEKIEAIFFLDSKRKSVEVNKEITDIGIKRAWNASEGGQRLIELKHFTKATEKILSSVKSRIYSQY